MTEEGEVDMFDYPSTIVVVEIFYKVLVTDMREDGGVSQMLMRWLESELIRSAKYLGQRRQ